MSDALEPARSAGVVGLGSMGMGVALSLLRAGFRVVGCDLDAAKCMSLVTHGGEAAGSPADVGRRVDRVIVLVATAEQAEEVLFGAEGVAGTLAKGGVVVLSTSVPPDMAAAVGRRLAERDLLMLDAPVGGGPVRAAEGRMVVMASGPDDAFARAEDLIAAASGTLHRVGTEHGQGSAVKAVEQMLTGIHAAAVAEATAFGVRAGVDPQRLAEILAAGPFHIPSQRPLGIVGTDLGSVMDAARRLTVPTPLAASALQLFTMAAAVGMGREGDGALVRIFDRLAGNPQES